MRKIRKLNETRIYRFKVKDRGGSKLKGIYLYIFWFSIELFLHVLLGPSQLVQEINGLMRNYLIMRNGFRSQHWDTEENVE